MRHEPARRRGGEFGDFPRGTSHEADASARLGGELQPTGGGEVEARGVGDHRGASAQGKVGRPETVGGT